MDKTQARRCVKKQSKVPEPFQATAASAMQKRDSTLSIAERRSKQCEAQRRYRRAHRAPTRAVCKETPAEKRRRATVKVAACRRRKREALEAVASSACAKPVDCQLLAPSKDIIADVPATLEMAAAQVRLSFCSKFALRICPVAFLLLLQDSSCLLVSWIYCCRTPHRRRLRRRRKTR